MRYRPLGRTGQYVSEICLGAMTFHGGRSFWRAIGTLDQAAATKLVAQTEGLLLDPIYTGKTMAALIAFIEAGRFDAGHTVVLLHTGGMPGIFANAGIYG